jgi:hypothetical protein
MLVRRFFLASLVASPLALAAMTACSSSATPSIPAPDAGDDTGTGTPPTDVDSGGSGPVDSGPPGTPITYGKCPAFTKCGGDVVGSWHLTNGCLSEDTFAAEKKSCPDLKESNVAIAATGTVDITATTMNRQLQVSLSAHIEMPKSCFPIPGITCATAGTLLTSGLLPGGLKFKTATCTDNASNAALCECDVTADDSQSVNTAYTATPDGTITTPAAAPEPQRTYDYCVANGTLTFTETTATEPLKMYISVQK